MRRLVNSEEHLNFILRLVQIWQYIQNFDSGQLQEGKMRIQSEKHFRK